MVGQSAGASSAEIQAKAIRQAAVRDLLEEESNFCYSLHHAGQVLLLFQTQGCLYGTFETGNADRQIGYVSCAACGVYAKT
eukprot:645953-Rhodomonas_salina.1